MLTEPMDVLKQFPIRKSGKQKETFRAAVETYSAAMGYPVSVEKGSFGARNIVIGDPNSAKYLVTAHYDTPASIGIPNFLTPCNLLVYLLYQFFVVGLFFGATFLIGLIVNLLTNNAEVTFIVCYIAYFGLLFLILLGPANRNNANDNTSGVVTVLEIMRTMPQMHRSKVCFVLFDLEEAGLIGSAAYRKAHKAQTESQIILNMDCVGDGGHLIFFPTKKAKQNEVLMRELKFLGGWFGQKQIFVKEKGFYTYPSDQKNFPVGIGIAAFHKKKGIGYYCDKIHTKKDTVLEMTNVNLLRAAITTLITGEKEGR